MCKPHCFSTLSFPLICTMLLVDEISWSGLVLTHRPRKVHFVKVGLQRLSEK